MSSAQNRTELENHSVDSSSTSEVVAFITLLQGLKRKLKDWKGKVEVCIYFFCMYPSHVLMKISSTGVQGWSQDT